MLKPTRNLILLILLVTCSIPAVTQTRTSKARAPTKGAVVTLQLSSVILRENRIGLDPQRNIKIYLPPGYTASGIHYPVVYYCHNIFYSAERLFADSNVVTRIEKGIADGIIPPFIFVAADYSSPTTGSLYENSITSGRWLDFTTQELVPYIDSLYRTIRHRNSRAITGDFMGARGALKLAMTHPDIFSVVYALHPVATGVGYIPWAANDVNWKKIYEAKNFAELAGEGRAQMFVAIAQAFLPNPNRPPFYCDFWMEPVNGEPTLHTDNMIKAQHGFLLDHTLQVYAPNLRKMRGIAFDWGRYDPTATHVYTNQAFTRQLEDLGIEHEAEEYRGNTWNKLWIPNGRVYTRMLPFLAQHLVFDE